MGAVEQTLRNSGMRWTAPRKAVLDVLRGRHGHLKPEDILRRARAKHRAIGRATVYRTLELLTKLGIIRPIYIGEDGPFYTAAEGGHHHLVCTGCGQVIEFDDCLACDMERKLTRKLGFRIQSHLLEFYGRCRKCG